ncbi:MAG: DsrE/DsrF/DrsH-like family protein [Gemmatimonadaceae bacterium]|nr:DsrE/DsrF/DrsH-like family protein [Gemmatimonadaceae bacterium]
MTTALETAAVPAGATSGANNDARATNRKVAIICSKGSLDMAYPGLILANAARMMGIDAVLFFTFWGMDIIRESTVDKLHAGVVGNPGAHMPAMLAGLPGVEGLATHMMKRKIAEIDVPTVRELLETLSDAGAELYACQMAMEMMGIAREELVPQVQDVITAMEFFEKSDGAQVIFI